jgi:hypothetical protein
MKNNSKYKRLLKRMPSEMIEFMNHISYECNIIDYHSGSMNWSAKFEINNTLFKFIYERGSYTVSKIDGQNEKVLVPFGKDIFEITLKDLAAQVNNELL